MEILGDDYGQDPWTVWQQIQNIINIEKFGHSLAGKTQLDRVRPRPHMPRGAGWLIAALSAKEAAANMQNKQAARQIIAGIDRSIASYLDSDDICPPWPWPGPPPWLSMIASELTLVANTLHEGSLRNSMLAAAGQVLDRVALNPQPLPP